ncbi:phage integrase SAM-like domain-containing protein [Dyadobacter sandarakinus]|uniref:Phage integrase SAM-like domain-containing protein n=1 Tax=Dyadobacter sandarakinus TaxID=2747268 RepID=A0ABX7I2C4_9BACT|nr:phage integrase SAM-like domain-containing protein [Dyadobacter sandarakinus]QRQ99691.1 phage integrase SAM-like domain-containing protein [Dyadobacter sandarakinus]
MYPSFIKQSVIKMRVRFIIRRGAVNKAGLCVVNCRITINGERANVFSTGVVVDPAKWESRLQKVKGSAQAVADLNRRLDLVRSEIEAIYIASRGRGVVLPADKVRDIYLGKDQLGCGITKLSELYLAQLKLKQRAKTTILRYSRSYKYLYQFLKKEMEVSEIGRKQVSGFWNWLKEKGYHNDYCNKIVQACIGLFKFAMREGYCDKSPFDGLALEWTKELDTTCLDAKEMDLLKKHPWSPRLERVVDSFLFMCYTGLHISDYRQIKEESRYTFEGCEFMKVRRIKTNVPSIFPLDKYALGLIEKYGSIAGLPKITGQKSNEYLKQIAEAVGIKKNLTNKIARKTFTDWCLNDLCLSEEVVATMLGHTSTRQVKHYGSIKERRILSEFKEKNIDFA